MGYHGAREHLRGIGITANGWGKLKSEYEDYLLGD
jgi:hypothetical protein